MNRYSDTLTAATSDSTTGKTTISRGGGPSLRCIRGSFALMTWSMLMFGLWSLDDDNTCTVSFEAFNTGLVFDDIAGDDLNQFNSWYLGQFLVFGSILGIWVRYHQL
jgi:hypothetical protein